ncbi:MAG: hypothetical protein M0Q93_00195 [Terrimicrobiaceae bacterium]|nr:hypothetical protein [Terrimicrobiaceae bacterium]
MLDVEEYKAAAIVCWGPELFTPEPHCTQLVWDALETHSKNLIMGGGSLSKSYSGAVYFGLDYIRDPEWTCLKVMSVTAAHAVTNIFAHLKNLLQSTIVPVPGLVVKTDSIRVNNDDKQGIHLVSIPQGDDGKGRLRGFHPVPRLRSHWRFGRLSRIGLLLDEAEEIPDGVWEDVNNVLLTEEADDSHVKVMAATNPKDRHSKFGRKAEPENGWSSVDIDIDETWESSEGWHITRLDGAKCENVVQERIVFPGLQTLDGFNNLLRMGTDNPEYYTMARGWFPEESSQAVVVTGAMFTACQGNLVFSGPTVSAGGVDLAFEGGDFVIFTHLRHGEAAGFRDVSGRYTPFRHGQRAIQVEQQIKLEKLPTLEQTKAIIRVCKDLSIKPAWLSVDRTGNGTGVHDALCSMFGPEVFGVMFSWASTDTKILEDDSEVCSERYHDVITEMAFSVRRFMETSILMFNPAMSWVDLERESVTRRYYQVGRGFVRLQSKKEFKKANGGVSPDFFDSLLVGVHGVRMNSGVTAQLVGIPAKKKNVSQLPRHGVIDELEFMDML